MRDNRDGTVTDEVTGLMWQQEIPEKMTWDEAVSYCEKLNLGGYTNWRLPTIQELKTLVDYTSYIPAINITYFPNTASSFYWSSTIHAYNTNYTWGVSFHYGDDHYYGKNNSYYIRAVREG